MDIKSKIKTNWLIFSIAFLIAISVGFPELFFVSEMGGKYQGISLMGTDAEDHYIASMRDAYDGDYGFGNVYSIPKDIPYMYPKAAESILGVFARITGLGVVNTNILMKFLAPFILFLLIYKLMFLLSGKKEVAILTASFIILGSNLIARPGEILGLFSLNGAYHSGFNTYFRSINPPISSILLFLYLIVFYKIIKNNKNIFSIIAGLILGASFYFYLYTWMYLAVFSFVFLLFMLFLKKYDIAKKILIVFAIGLAISVPYWIEVFRAANHVNYNDASLRFGLVHGHSLFFSKTLILLLPIGFMLLANYIRRKTEYLDMFGIVFIISIFTVYNQQIITGRVIQSSHYHFIATIPFLLGFLVVFSWSYFDRIDFLKNYLIRVSVIGGIIIALLGNNYKWQMFSYEKTKETAVAHQDYKKVIDWLDNNVKKDGLVFGSQPLSQLIPIFTSLNIYPAGFAQYYLISEEVLRKQFFIEFKFGGLDENNVAGRFKDDLRNKLSYGIFGLRYGKEIPDSVIDNLVQEYAAFYKQDLKQVLDEDYYKPDYFVFDQKFNELVLPESEIKNIMEKVADIDKRFLVYKINQ